jgi:hypothetical protein
MATSLTCTTALHFAESENSLYHKPPLFITATVLLATALSLSFITHSARQYDASPTLDVCDSSTRVPLFLMSFHSIGAAKPRSVHRQPGSKVGSRERAGQAVVVGNVDSSRCFSIYHNASKYLLCHENTEQQYSTSSSLLLRKVIDIGRGQQQQDKFPSCTVQ